MEHRSKHFASAVTLLLLQYFISADDLERRMVRVQSNLGSHALKEMWENQATVALEV